ncbi:hypothetical protein FRIG_06555, partial [Frigoribacterium faeni]|uniref:hypothetical protein n=1 Tax=Frigoribacterium faeni TaxID=145483 RepID=UPI001FAB3DD2
MAPTTVTRCEVRENDEPREAVVADAAEVRAEEARLEDALRAAVLRAAPLRPVAPVSYTHLTLPT